MVLESLTPRDPQSVHYIQDMLCKLSEYSIPIRKNPDLAPEKSEALDIKTSFKQKYLNNILNTIKTYLKSNEEIQDLFFQWLEQNGISKEKPTLSREEISHCLRYITDHKGVLPSNAPPLARDLIKYLDLNVGDDYKNELQTFQDNEFKHVVKCLTDPGFLTHDDFEKIILMGDESFDSLDPRLKIAIQLSGFRGKLSTSFKTQIKGRLHLDEKQQEMKKAILDKYKEIYIPKMVKKITDEDVQFLLERLGVIKCSQNAKDS